MPENFPQYDRFMEVNSDTFSGPSFGLANRIARFAWGVVAYTVFRFSPRPFHRWRALILRLFGAKVGKGVHVYPGAQIWAPWNLNLADDVGVGDGATLYSQAKISIGRRSVISQGAHLCTGTHDYTQPGSPLVARPIIIGSQVWIAAEVFVHPGITVGDGCVVGARSVVTRDMPEWTVCAGHPCVPIKPRILNSLIN
jgi:putative colanic acid biosynthesis acetyltransferase WcaF